MLGGGPIGLLILQVLKTVGAGEIHVIEPLARRRAAALELGANDVFATAKDFLDEAGKGGCPLVIEATNSPLGFRDAVRASRIGGRVVLPAFRTVTPIRLSSPEARRRAISAGAIIPH